jgi:hypothetical protein
MTVAVVLLDANVLYPAPLRDLLLQLAYAGLFQARWSADIDHEWTRNLLTARPELAAQRFGEDTTRAMLRAKGGSIETVSVPRAHQAAVATVSRTVHALWQGERASERQAEAERLAQRQTLGSRARMRP